MDFSSYQFSPVIDLPDDYEVYDFSKEYDPNRDLKSPFGVGKYNEIRPRMYSHQLFAGVRNIHMGIDIGAPVGTPVMSFYSGEIFLFANNNEPGDYGNTIITKQQLGEHTLFALYGHLSASSIDKKQVGEKLKRGQVFAWLGDKTENGGWNSHLHFQLCLNEPKKADLPGVVSQAEHSKALELYPDPRLVLGQLYI